MLFFKNEVRKSVVKIIDTRIKAAQKDFDSGCKQLAEESFRKIEEIHKDHQTQKALLLKDCVAAALRS